MGQQSLCAVICIVVGTTGCGEVKIRPDGGNMIVTVTPGRTFLRAGSSEDLDVSVERGGVGGTIEITAAGLPVGVSAKTVTIPDGESATTLTLSATAAATQGDAEIAVAAKASAGATGMTNVQLLVGGNPGTLDLSFGRGGKLKASFGLASVEAHGIALQADGKVVGTGSTGNQAVTYRVLIDGSLDESFGSAGVITTGIDQQPSCGGIVPVVLTDGRIVVAGWCGTTAGWDAALFGYTPNGSLDGDFGSSGTVRLALGTASDQFQDLVVDNGGGLLATGVHLDTSPTTTLRRYTAQGNADGAYTVISSPSANAGSAHLSSNGKAILAGHNGAGNFWLQRHLADGNLDTGFGSGGRVITDLGGADVAAGVIEVDGGKVVAAGVSAGKAALVRYNANGSPDLTFGDSGVAISTVAFNQRGFDLLAQDSQGRLLVGGFVDQPQRLPAVLRFRSDGKLDEAFGNGGVAIVELDVATSTTTSVVGIAIDPDDRVIVSCNVGAVGAQTVGLVRLWP